MSTIAESISIPAQTEAADRRRRIVAIVGASSGNLVEWYDFYAYAFTSIYFASAFSPQAMRPVSYWPQRGLSRWASSCDRWAAGCSDGSLLGAVDLHEFASAVPAIARLVHGLEP